MNYSRHYDKLMARGCNRLLSGYTERHHIVPRCLGGSNDPLNLVNLTPEEHYVAHQLLVKMYPNNAGLVRAAIAMTVDRSGKRVHNKRFGWLRRKDAEVQRQIALTNENCIATRIKKGQRIGKETEYKKGRKLSEKQRLAIIASNHRRKGKPHNVDHALMSRIATERNLRRYRKIA